MADNIWSRNEPLKGMVSLDVPPPEPQPNRDPNEPPEDFDG